MGRTTAFAIEKLKNDVWQMHDQRIDGFPYFSPLQQLHYSPSHTVYSVQMIGEFAAIICGIGNDDEYWCEPISRKFGLPENVSKQALEEFNKTSDPAYGEPICITLKQMMEYDLTSGWTGEENQKEPFSDYVLKGFNLLVDELAKIDAPDKVRIIFWFF